jgi:filamentous hemagglutinin family protein
MSASLFWHRVFFLAFAIFFFGSSTKAQIAPDGTTATQVNTPDGNNFDINGGDTAGGNLFHSFGNFSVPTGGSANFLNSPEINNIISRVTGGNVSTIDGLIKASGSANLFLINPAGIIFGQNARLDIGGSFLGSTADSLLFGDGTEFSATNLQKPILTINAPIGLNLRDNPSPINNNSLGGLQVQPGKSVTLVGGNLSFDGGKIFAPGGRVELGSLLGAGKIEISDNGSLTFPEGIGRGDITLANNSEVNVRADGGGFIGVNARNLELSQKSQITAGIGEDLGSPEAIAGDININATDSVKIIGEKTAFPVPEDEIPEGEEKKAIQEGRIIEQNTSTSIKNQVGISSDLRSPESDRSTAKGNGGKISIVTKNLESFDVASIDTSLYGEGNAGNIDIQAENITFDGIKSLIGSQVKGDNFSRIKEKATGNAGNININTNSLTLNNQGLIQTDLGNGTTGNAGNINIQATDSITLREGSLIFTQVGAKAIGSGGKIEIATGNLNLTGGSLLISQTLGQGNAGDIIINAKGDVSLDSSNTRQKGSLILAQVFGSDAIGNAGKIDITTGNLFLKNNSQFLAQTSGNGNAGDIFLNATGKIDLSGGSLILASVEPGGKGNGGRVEINTGDLNFTDRSLLIADTKAKGDAGNITINARGNINLDKGSEIVSGTGIKGTNVEGNAGEINITAEGIFLKDFSLITASTNKNAIRGDAKNINITTNNLEISRGSVISALTENSSNAGNINLDIQNLNLNSGGKIVTGTDSAGKAGSINVNVANNFNLDGSNAPDKKQTTKEIFSEPLVQNLITETGLFANSTAQSTGNSGSIFVQANNLNLDNKSTISAATNFGEGGNINLKVGEILKLNNNSLISAQASQNASGGNLNIDAKFIVASPNQNSDIVANAEKGKGGNIDITTEGIFGLQERRATSGNLTNDIDASSEFGLEGTVSIKTPDTNPTQAFILSPENIVAPEEIAAQVCSASGDVANASSFTVTGRGGMPTDPTKPLNSSYLSGERPSEDKGTRGQGDKETGSRGEAIKLDGHKKTFSSDEVIPARGMMVNEKGQIVLTAYPTPNTTNIDRKLSLQARCQG